MKIDRDLIETLDKSQTFKNALFTLITLFAVGWVLYTLLFPTIEAVQPLPGQMALLTESNRELTGAIRELKTEIQASRQMRDQTRVARFPHE